MTEKSTKKNDGNKRGGYFREMTGFIGKMTGKSTWKVSGMESFYNYSRDDKHSLPANSEVQKSTQVRQTGCKANASASTRQSQHSSSLFPFASSFFP